MGIAEVHDFSLDYEIALHYVGALWGAFHQGAVLMPYYEHYQGARELLRGQEVRKALLRDG
ncbi:MAG: hypothetical protein Q9N34_03760 [Aquificota bacterium]|nr:hypothetical protein [Aquificota bacterium]